MKQRSWKTWLIAGPESNARISAASTWSTFIIAHCLVATTRDFIALSSLQADFIKHAYRNSDRQIIMVDWFHDILAVPNYEAQ